MNLIQAFVVICLTIVLIGAVGILGLISVGRNGVAG